MTARGFTLLELLAVMAITAVLLALVLPLGWQTLERSQRERDLARLMLWAESAAQRAWLAGEAQLWRVDAHAIEAQPPGEPVRRHVFEHITLPPGTLEISPQGRIRPAALNVSWGDQTAGGRRAVQLHNGHRLAWSSTP